MTRERKYPPFVARRRVLQTGAGLVVASAVPGCGFFDTDPADESGAGGGAKGKEAPMLKERVEEGKLPKVAARLPDKPLVVEPLDKAGVYGGTWHSAMLTEEDVPWLKMTMGYEPLLRWSPKWEGSAATEILANVCEEYEVLGGGREYVFTLRRGMKWSDGEPLTADDFDFCYNDYQVYPDLHPDAIYELWLNQNGEPARFVKEDDHTVRYVFAEPKANFLEQIAGLHGLYMFLPKHFLEQFHLKYNKSADSVAKKNDMANWVEFLPLRLEHWVYPDVPTVNGWVAQNAVGVGSNVVAERNPYYWKTDPDGSQLPYIDKVVCEVVQDVEVEVLKVSNGDLGLQLYNFGTVRNKPVISRNQESGDYRMIEMLPDDVNTMIIGFNQTHPDPAKARMYGNKDFRIGLSHAIDRKKIINTLHGGQGIPWQCAPVPGTDLHDEELGKQFTEYDLDLANEYLDRAGLRERNGDGIRLREDGSPVKFNVLVASEYPDQVDALDLIKSDWREVGVDITVQRMAEELYWVRVESGESDASVWTGGSFDIRTGAGGNHYYLPSNPRGSSRFGGQWALWYWNPGKDGTEPPARVKRQLELFDRMRATFDRAKATSLARQVLEITKEEFYYLGISTMPTEYGIVRNDFHNVPEKLPGAGAWQAPGPARPEQFYLADEA